MGHVGRFGGSRRRRKRRGRTLLKWSTSWLMTTEPMSPVTDCPVALAPIRSCGWPRAQDCGPNSGWLPRGCQHFGSLPRNCLIEVPHSGYSSLRGTGYLFLSKAAPDDRRLWLSRRSHSTTLAAKRKFGRSKWPPESCRSENGCSAGALFCFAAKKRRETAHG